MSMFQHHPANLSALEASAEEIEGAIRQAHQMRGRINSVAAQIPSALEGKELINSSRGATRQLVKDADAVIPAFELQATSTRHWIELVKDFNHRVDGLNRTWDDVNPSGWQRFAQLATGAAQMTWLMNQLTDFDQEAYVADLRAQLTARYRTHEQTLDELALSIADTLKVGPGPQVDAFYRDLDAMMTKAVKEREAAEAERQAFQKAARAIYGDGLIGQIKAELAAGMSVSLAGLADLVVMVSPWSPIQTGRFAGIEELQLTWDDMPSHLLEEKYKDVGIDVRGPAFNLGLVGMEYGSLVIPGAGAGKFAASTTGRSLLASMRAIAAAAGRETPNLSRAWIKQAVKETRLSEPELIRLASKDPADLTPSEVNNLWTARQAVPHPTSSTEMQKVITSWHVDRYLNPPEETDPSVVSGFIARRTDVEQLDTPRKLFDGLALDYPGTRYSPDDSVTYVVRFRTTEPESISVPHSESFGGDTIQAPPFTGSGFTKTKMGLIPEWETKDELIIERGAQIYSISKTGREEIVAHFDGRNWVVPNE